MTTKFLAGGSVEKIEDKFWRHKNDISPDFSGEKRKAKFTKSASYQWTSFWESSRFRKSLKE